MKVDWTLEVLDEDGGSHPLDSVLPASWCLLVLYRHAECMECNLLSHALSALQLQQWEVQVLGVATGGPESLRRLRQRVGLSPEVRLYAHPQRELHRQLDLKSSLWGAWGPKAIWHTLRGFQEGHLQTSLGFPMSQQSGLVLLDDQRELRWLHRSQYLGDIPGEGEILEQVLKARSQGA